MQPASCNIYQLEQTSDRLWGCWQPSVKPSEHDQFTTNARRSFYDAGCAANWAAYWIIQGNSFSFEISDKIEISLSDSEISKTHIGENCEYEDQQLPSRIGIAAMPNLLPIWITALRQNSIQQSFFRIKDGYEKEDLFRGHCWSRSSERPN
jgi:hypothetical protein